MPEQHIAQRAAAERGDAAEHRDTEPVHLAPPGRQRRRHRLGDQGEQSEEEEN